MSEYASADTGYACLVASVMYMKYTPFGGSPTVARLRRAYSLIYMENKGN